jgi:phosphoribosyl-ATP pyrophosphohydrolase
MATPRRIYRIYHRLAQDAAELQQFMQAMGKKSGTIDMLVAQDRAKLLTRWGEEMEELCGVLDGSHDDSYLMEATQTFYWATLFAVTGGVTWEDLGFQDLRVAAVTCGLHGVDDLRATATRLVALGAEQAKPAKLFLLWNVADHIYRRQTRIDQQWSMEQLMEADLQDMKKRDYLEPILRMVGE